MVEQNSEKFIFAQLGEENRWDLNASLLIFNLELSLYWDYYIDKHMNLS